MTLDPCLRAAVLALLPTMALALAENPADAVRVRPFEAADVFDLEYASDPQIAPDGSKIVYVRNFMDIMQDRRRSNLWLIDLEGLEDLKNLAELEGLEDAARRHRPLTSGTANHASPRWSPDGERLAWITDEGGSSQIHVRWMATGESARVTRLTHPPSNLTWSRRGNLLAFTAFVPDKVEPFVTMPEPPEGAEWAPPARVITEYLYRDDGTGYREPGHTHLFFVPADGSTPRQLTFGNFDCGAPSWTLDDELVFAANLDEERKPLDSDIYRVDLDGTRELLIDRNGPDLAPAVSPDGTSIAYVGCDDEQKGYLQNHLWLANLDGEEARCLTLEFDRDLAHPTWSADGSGIFVSYDDQGTTKIALIPVSGLSTEQGIEPAVVATDVGGTTLGRPYPSGSFSVSRTDLVAFTLTAPSHPADVALTGRRRAGTARLTRLNDDLLGARSLAPVEQVRVEAEDGWPIPAWIALPPGFDPAVLHPLILEIHGGPFLNYGPRFAAEIQLYAAAGYVVLYVNPRGSTSYGAEFANLIDMNYPGDDYGDLMAAVDAALLKGYVDPERLFVTGGSGGGVLTAWIVGKTNRFRAAVVAKPVINWASFVLTADAYNFFWRYWFPGPPWENVQHYWDRSPLSLVGNVETPTMLLTGEDDYRTPISESEQFYQALKMRGVDTAFVRIPGAGHGIAARPSHLISKVLHILAWFERYDTPGEDR